MKRGVLFSESRDYHQKAIGAFVSSGNRCRRSGELFSSSRKVDIRVGGKLEASQGAAAQKTSTWLMNQVECLPPGQASLVVRVV